MPNPNPTNKRIRRRGQCRPHARDIDYPSGEKRELTYMGIIIVEQHGMRLQGLHVPSSEGEAGFLLLQHL